MKHLPRVIGLFHVVFLATAMNCTADEFTFQPSPPAAQGMSAERLDALRDSLAKNSTKIFFVMRHDRVVYEWYAPDWSADKPHYTASMAKAIVGGLSTAIAMQDHRLTGDDPAA